MALKDWQETGIHDGSGKINKEQFKYIVAMWGNGSEIVTINRPFRKGETEYLVWSTNKDIRKSFKKSIDAIAYAKKYMRSH